MGETNVDTMLLYAIFFSSPMQSLTFCKLDGFNCVLSIILMATSFPVGKCLANFTLAKLPFPIVFSNCRGKGGQDILENMDACKVTHLPCNGRYVAHHLSWLSESDC